MAPKPTRVLFVTEKDLSFVLVESMCGGPEKTKEILRVAKERGVPIMIGVCEDNDFFTK